MENNNNSLFDMPKGAKKKFWQRFYSFKTIMPTQHPEVLKAIKINIKNSNFSQLQKIIKDYPKTILLEQFIHLSNFEKILFFRLLTKSQAAIFFNDLDAQEKAELLTSFSDDLSTKIIKSLKSDEIKDLIDEMPTEVMHPLLKKIKDPKKRRAINALLKFDENQIGSLMRVDFSSVISNWTLADAKARIKNDWKEKISLNHYFFVTNQEGVFEGAISFEDIIFNDPTKKVSEIAFQVSAVKTYDDLQYAAQIFAKQDISVLPVINHSNYLAGIVTAEDMVDLIHEEVTEDIYRQVAITTNNLQAYTKTPILQLIRSRLVWLFLLLISATFSQIALQTLTNVASQTISTFISTSILSTLIPVLSDAAGNAGGQSSSAVIRAAALGEFNQQKFAKFIRKEMYTGLILGMILFFVNFLRLIIYFSIEQSLIVNPQNIIILIFASSLALWITITLSKILGIIIPLWAYKLKKDPAVLSASLLTTLLDALSIMIFFAIAIGVFRVLGVQ